MYVENPHGNEDGEGDENHGEEEVLSKKGNGQRGGGNDFGQQEEEHSQWQQDWYAQSHLLKNTCTFYSSLDAFALMTGFDTSFNYI